MSKTFPDKLLTNNQNRWHIFSIIFNGLAVAGLLFALISLLGEIGNAEPEALAPFMVMLCILIILLVLLVFIFVCQLVLKKFLRSKNEMIVKSMIDSIGNENGPA